MFIIHLSLTHPNMFTTCLSLTHPNMFITCLKLTHRSITFIGIQHYLVFNSIHLPYCVVIVMEFIGRYLPPPHRGNGSSHLYGVAN